MDKMRKLLCDLIGSPPDKFTPELLDQVVEKVIALRGTGHPDPYTLHLLRETAERCATWMREGGLKEAHFVRGNQSLSPRGLSRNAAALKSFQNAPNE